MKLVGERRALAAVTFAFYFLVYLLFALLRLVPAELGPAFYALAGVYGLAFFALVAGYFWARWYAVGVGLFGVITAAIGVWKDGAEPVLLFLGGTHLAATLMLWGSAMSEGYDGQTAWRQRLHMDDNAVQRLGRSVIRAGLPLPLVLLYALAPKPGGVALVAALAAAAALILGGLGLRALLRLKTWGVLAIAAAGVLMLALAGVEVATDHDAVALVPALGGSLLVFAAAPWARPIANWLARTV